MIKLLTSRKFLLLFVLVTLYVFSAQSQNCNCNHTIALNQEIVDGAQLKVKPGDKVCIQAGKRKFLWLSNFNGTPGQPVIIVNCGGQVVVSNSDRWGISISSSKNFKLLGNGDPNYKYGIKIDGVAAVALSFNRLTSDFETAFIEVHKSLGPALMAKSDPECGKPETWRGNFVMRNVNIHNFYVHDVGTKAAGGEGFYIGHSFFNGIDTNCGKLFPHNIENIKVHDNIIEKTAFDGMQVSCAVSGTEVYNNVIRDYGTLNNGSQQTGLVVGGGSKGKFYNNTINKGTGSGMTVFGQGDLYIYNNTISNTDQEGIFFDDRTTDPNLTFNFYNNTIINSKTNGITVYSGQSKLSTFYNNLVVAPGNWPKFWDYKRAFIYLENIPGKIVKFDTANNYFCKNLSDAHFVDPANLNFRLKASSPAVDRGRDLTSKGVSTDRENKKRPAGKAFDIGAYESGSTAQIPSDLKAQATSLNATCFGSSTGKASVTVSGGTSPYTFLWSNGKTTQSIDGLASGSYTVTVKDKNGNQAVASVSVGQPANIAINHSKTDATSTVKGSINLSVSGGTSPYTFSWSNGSTTEDLSNLSAGNYTVTVQDKNGCKKSASITIVLNTNSGGTSLNGVFNLISKKSGMYMDIAGASMNSQADVVIWTANNYVNQQFKITPSSDGYYTIVSQNSGKALDVQWGGTGNGTKIWQYNQNGTDAQKWKIESLGNGYYKITSKRSGRAISSKTSAAGRGDGVLIWDYSGQDHQIWKLQAISGTSAKRDGELSEEPAFLASFNAYPNPVKSDLLNISIHSDKEVEATISILNAVSQREIELKQTLVAGDNRVEISVGNLKNGVHLLIVNKGEVRLVKKIMVAR